SLRSRLAGCTCASVTGGSAAIAPPAIMPRIARSASTPGPLIARPPISERPPRDGGGRIGFGRAGEIRTRDLPPPRRTRYQAAPRPDAAGYRMIGGAGASAKTQDATEANGHAEGQPDAGLFRSASRCRSVVRRV